MSDYPENGGAAMSRRMLPVIAVLLLGACSLPRLPSIPSGSTGSTRPSSIEEYERQVQEYRAKLAGAEAGLSAAREAVWLKRMEALAWVGVVGGSLLIVASILALVFVAPLRSYAGGGIAAGVLIIAGSVLLMKVAPYLAWIAAVAVGLAGLAAAAVIVYRFRRHDTALGRAAAVPGAVEPIALGDCLRIVEDARKRQRPRRLN